MSLDSKQLQKPVRKLRKLLKNAAKHPFPEQVHDLRTNTRRLEAALASVSCNPRPRDRKLLKELGRICKRAGKARDMDVLTGFAASVRVLTRAIVVCSCWNILASSGKNKPSACTRQ